MCTPTPTLTPTPIIPPTPTPTIPPTPTESHTPSQSASASDSHSASDSASASCSGPSYDCENEKRIWSQIQDDNNNGEIDCYCPTENGCLDIGGPGTITVCTAYGTSCECMYQDEDFTDSRPGLVYYANIFTEDISPRDCCDE